LKEERRLRVFENRVLRRIFGPKRDEMTVALGKLHNEELNDLYCQTGSGTYPTSCTLQWVRGLSWR